MHTYHSPLDLVRERSPERPVALVRPDHCLPASRVKSWKLLVWPKKDYSVQHQFDYLRSMMKFSELVLKPEVLQALT